MIHRFRRCSCPVLCASRCLAAPSVPLAAALRSPFVLLPGPSPQSLQSQAFYPLNNLISSGEARSAPGPEPGATIPALRLLSRGPAPAAAAGQQREVAAAGVERLELELDTGKGGAWGVMNFTGEVLGWSLSDKVAEVPLSEVSLLSFHGWLAGLDLLGWPVELSSRAGWLLPLHACVWGSLRIRPAMCCRVPLTKLCPDC